MRRRAAAARASELLTDVGLEEAADRRVSGYSSGMRARLSLARALLREPPALLLDEPTQSLDPVAAAEFRVTILRLAADRGSAVLLATHNLHEAAALAQRTVLLASGSVVCTKPSGTDAFELESTMVAAAGA
jgi:ABC-2 type transport system ATP-binding protein